MSKLKAGDIFTIPLENGEVGFGQIQTIGKSSTDILIVVFDKKSSNHLLPQIKVILSSNIIFMGIVILGRFKEKRKEKKWKTIKNEKIILKKNDFPIFKVGDIENGEAWITDHHGKYIRRATKPEFEVLEYLTASSPEVFSGSLQEYYGLKEQEDEWYDEIYYPNIITRKNFKQKVREHIAKQKGKK